MNGNVKVKGKIVKSEVRGWKLEGGSRESRVESR